MEGEERWWGGGGLERSPLTSLCDSLGVDLANLQFTGRAKPGYPRNCIDHPSESKKVTNMVGVVVEAMICWQKKNRHTQIRNPVTLHCHNQITTFLSSTMPSRSNKFKRQLATLFSAVEGSPELLDLLQNTTSPTIKIIFIVSGIHKNSYDKAYRPKQCETHSLGH